MRGYSKIPLKDSLVEPAKVALGAWAAADRSVVVDRLAAAGIPLDTGVRSHPHKFLGCIADIRSAASLKDYRPQGYLEQVAGNFHRH
ncbi:hypothetical protein [Varibaculum prostatecancerukia]|uniref:hypothetical protein n=1 Tax=Varibaculum prostatecancerukia TaxID=2811781 RepID=UPI001C004357|nr:hypothetical protein [Varibaculum prostatecancerukia]